MSDLAPRDRAERLIDLLPILAGLTVHAVAHARAWFAIPLALGCGVAIATRVTVRHSSPRLLVAGAAGMIAGFAGLWIGQPPPGPIPPVVLSPLCGAVAGFAVFCVLSRSVIYAWIYAALLVVLSLHVPPSPALFVALALFAGAILACAFTRGQLARTGLPGVAAFGIFAVLLGAGTYGVSELAHRAEGTLMDAVYQLLKDPEALSGVGVDQQLSLSARSKVGVSMKPLLELSGALPRKLRMTVLEQFDGTSWTRSAPHSLERGNDTAADATLTELNLLLLAPLGDHLPTPAGTREVLGAETSAEGDGLRRIEHAVGRPLLLRRDAQEQLSRQPFPSGTLTELPDPLRLELTPLAASLLGPASTTRAKAEAIETFFREKFEYSLSTDLRGKGSPLAVLIRERRPAYCIYFASAMAALLRTEGIATRVIGGFVPEEQNRLTGDTVVRQRDAHAWVEVYLPEEGRFVAFDPTPWRSRDSVLGLDERGGIWSDVAGAISSLFRRGSAWIFDAPLATLGRVARSPVSWIAIGVLVIWRLRARRRRVPKTRVERPTISTDPALAAAFARYLRVLARQGIVARPAETDDELLARLRQARGEELFALASRFVDGYRCIRYRGVALDGPQPTELLGQLERAADSTASD